MQQNIVQSCFHQYCNNLIVFSRVVVKPGTNKDESRVVVKPGTNKDESAREHSRDLG
jgi:hypothetical protein